MANSPVSRKKKILRWVIGILVVALAVFVYFRFYFVFGDGVKSGELNIFVRKGYVFKTYEGRIIQAGYYSSTGGVQSNQFEFSVTDKEVADELEMSSGKFVDLHYKEYLGRLPWRGMSKYVVDKVIRIHERALDQTPPIGLSAPAAAPGVE